MAGYYVHENYIVDGINTCPGVQKKVLEQINTIGTKTQISEVVVDLKSNSLKNKLLRRLPGGSNLYHWDDIFDYIINPDFVYIRKPLLDYGSHLFLRQIRKKYPDAKMLLEIPTYPYDREYLVNYKRIPMFLKEWFYRNQLKKFVNRIVTYSDDKKIFGIPTICIQNGINVKEHPVRNPKKDTSEIHLIAVACFQRAHGYERIIKGLGEYYRTGGSRRVILDLVGSGDEVELYKQLADSLELQENVVFWGPRHDAELTEVFDKADIGLAPFGFYKHGIEVSSALKLREYLARGLPVVAGSRQDVFTEETFSYYLEFPNNDSTVDIKRIVDFYDRIYHGTETYKDVICNIRKYAEENVTWEKTFCPVVTYLLTDGIK